MQKFNVVKDDNDDDGLLEELGGLEDDDEEEPVKEEEAVEESSACLYNEQFRRKLAEYRRQAKQSAFAAQTVESNLDAIFSQFQVFTQQRHKISLEEINEFEAEESSDEVSKAKNCLASSVFSQLNPFSQFVIEEIV